MVKALERQNGLSQGDHLALTGVMVETQVNIGIRVRPAVVEKKVGQAYEGCIGRLLQDIEVQGRGSVRL